MTTDKLQNGLTMAETERLGKLQTELAEAAKEVGNIIMYGYASWNPLVQDSGDNRRLLQDEVVDIAAVVDLMIVKGDFNPNQMQSRRIHKRMGQLRFMRHQGEVSYPQDRSAESQDPWETDKQKLLAAMRAANLMFMQVAGGQYIVQAAPQSAMGQVVMPQVFTANPEDQV